GPRSAGADPGPACYGKGGNEPTITDANLALGRLNPHFFLGGRVTLDVERARAAIQTRCATMLGLDVVETARAIVEIANTAMVNALRLVSVQRGYDPRDFVLVAFGGAGPVHANRLAEETEVGTLLVPLSPGTTSALGLLVTDLKRDYSQSLLQSFDQLDPLAVDAAFRHLEEQGSADLRREAVRAEDVAFLRQFEMRYVGQSYELTVSVPDTSLGPADLAAARSQFHREHDRAYGYSAPEEPVELVNLRSSAIGRMARPRLREISGAARSVSEAEKARRPVYFTEAGGFVDCPIYDRSRLSPSQVISGPAVIEEFDSTTLVHPGFRARVDRFGNLLLTR
ncbi:MAG: hydantoinase/oxoprolinase family protein, partial [Candidatus Dormibacteraceae bacterium]